MSSESSDTETHTKVYKLKSRKNFQEWKQKTLSLASSKGYEMFLLGPVAVKTETGIDQKEMDYINETDDVKSKKIRKELSKFKSY